MRVPLLCSVLAVLSGCGTTDFAAEFAAFARNMPAGGKVFLEFRGGEITRYAASVDPATIPAAARRTADEIVQPGGKTVFPGGEWSVDASGYRFVKLYEDGGSVRTVLVDHTGKVLARSHQVPVADSPEEARAAALSVAGKIERVEVVQRERGSADVFRFGLIDTDGRRWFAVTTATGHIIERGREVNAQIFFTTR